ncbi:hypothetical protein C2E23DRAFT_596510 [Lenzites betulinus]|nr:hypothetical protein C2E23DRAFT_596510 [Lenzites betulinus]
MPFTTRSQASSFNSSSRCPSPARPRALPGGCRVSRSHSPIHAGRTCPENLRASCLSSTQYLPGVDHNRRRTSRPNSASPSRPTETTSCRESSGRFQVSSGSRSTLRWSAVAALFLLSVPSLPCAEAGVIQASARRDAGHSPSVLLPSSVFDVGAYPSISRWKRQTAPQSSSGGPSASISATAASSGVASSGSLDASSSSAPTASTSLTSVTTAASASVSASGSVPLTSIPPTSVSLPISPSTSISIPTSLSSLTSISLPTTLSVSSLSLSLPSSSPQSSSTTTQASSGSTSAASSPTSASPSSASVTNASSSSAPLTSVSPPASQSSSSQSPSGSMSSS